MCSRMVTVPAPPLAPIVLVMIEKKDSESASDKWNLSVVICDTNMP